MLQYQWLEELGFNCSEQKEVLFALVKQHGYTLREIDEEVVLWKFGSRYRGSA